MFQPFQSFQPSFLAHILGGIFLAIALGVYAYNYSTIPTTTNVLVLFLASIAVSLHSITHHNEDPK